MQKVVTMSPTSDQASMPRCNVDFRMPILHLYGAFAQGRPKLQLKLSLQCQQVSLLSRLPVWRRLPSRCEAVRCAPVLQMVEI